MQNASLGYTGLFSNQALATIELGQLAISKENNGIALNNFRSFLGGKFANSNSTGLSLTI